MMESVDELLRFYDASRIGQWCHTVGELVQFLSGIDPAKEIMLADGAKVYVWADAETVTFTDESV